MTTFQNLNYGSKDWQAAQSGNDPCFSWAEASGFVDYALRTKSGSPSFLVVFQINAGYGCEELLKCMSPAGGIDASVLAQWKANDGTVFGVAHASGAARQRLAAEAATPSRWLTRFETSLFLQDPRPRRTATQPLASAVMPKFETSASTVLLGVVDYGCPFAHVGLRREDKSTRILNFWDQGINEGAIGTLGKAFSRKELSAFMADAPSSGGSIDEACCYRQGGFDSLASRGSHGAHVLGLLVGANASPSFLSRDGTGALPGKPWIDTATTSDIVFVQLPPEYLLSMPRTGLAPYQLLAMKYILECAGANTSQVVIPISSEAFEGPHDGSSLLECAIDALVEHARTTSDKSLDIVFASGNAGNLSTCLSLPEPVRSRLTPVTHETTLTIRLLPNNELPTLVELWFDSGAPDITLSIAPPGQSPAAPLSSGAWVWPDVLAPECAVIYPGGMQPGCKSRSIFIRIAPTFSVSGSAAVASFGDWRIKLLAESPIQGGWAYVARSYPGVGGKRRSYQSYFPERRVGTDFEFLYNKPVATHGRGSINGLACGSNVTVVSGYVLHPRKKSGDGVRAAYAGRGPARGGRLGLRDLLDRAAPSDESPCLPGLKSWGHTSGASVRMSGTSVAAPLAARELAQFGWMRGSAASNQECEPQLEPQERLGR